MRWIYVIARNGGCEGYSAPIQAFEDLKEARAALALLDSAFELFEVPIWPEKSTEWFRIKPMKEAAE